MAVTRNDVASRAGVSPAVVSFVLNPGSRPVATETRARVLAAIDELGYRPNALAQALRRGGSRTIGMVQPDQVNPFFGELAQSIENHAFARDYVLLVGSTADEEARELRYVQAFVDRQVDGLILIAAGGSQAEETALSSGLPVVLVDRVGDQTRQSSVRTNGCAGARDATSHLLELGHRRIGCIAGSSSLHADDRVEGWRESLVAAGLEPDLLARSPYSLDGGRDAAELLVSRGATAIMACSDVQAVGALTHCRSVGLSVPDDISVVGFDGTELAVHSHPPLTVVQQPIEEIGRLALERLVDRIENSDAPARQDVLPAKLLVRATTAPPPGK